MEGDPWAEVEAMEQERLDADLEQAEMYRQGAALEAARKAGRCCHQGAVGYIGQVVYPEQEGLEPGQLRCTDGCGQVFASDEDWWQAMHDAIEGAS